MQTNDHILLLLRDVKVLFLAIRTDKCAISTSENDRYHLRDVAFDRVYYYDVALFSKTLDRHLSHMRQTFDFIAGIDFKIEYLSAY